MKTMTRREEALQTSVAQLQQAAADCHSMSRVRPNSRIVYLECKDGALVGPSRIGRVTFSRTGSTLYYRGQRFQSLKGAGFKSNYFDVETGADYWISGPKRDGSDRLYGGRAPIEIDEDVREEYWTEIRREPEMVHRRFA